MENRQLGNIVTNVAIALFAGVFASLVTLVASERLRVEPVAEILPETSQPQLHQADNPAQANADESAQAEPSIEDLMALQAAFDEASAERSQLAATLVTLTRQIDNLESELVNLNARNAQAAENLALQEDAFGNSVVMPESHRREGFGGEGFAGFGEQGGSQLRLESLLAAGLDEQSARDLQVRRDQFQLARLELFDQAAREGWSDSEQLTDRLEELDADRVDLRAELGDDAYDQYLYASGSPNRVTVASVINGSAADLAGLQAGDIVESYASERVFRAQELQQATRSGTRGAFVQLVFSRDGQGMSTDIPRGPMGVTLGSTRIQP